MESLGSEGYKRALSRVSTLTELPLSCRRWDCHREPKTERGPEAVFLATGGGSVEAHTCQVPFSVLGLPFSPAAAAARPSLLPAQPPALGLPCFSLPFPPTSHISCPISPTPFWFCFKSQKSRNRSIRDGDPKGQGERKEPSGQGQISTWGKSREPLTALGSWLLLPQVLCKPGGGRGLQDAEYGRSLGRGVAGPELSFDRGFG